jgi:hypothetical protein
MGHTINPISNRLNISIFWKSKWCTYTNYNYKYLVLTDLVFFKFLFFLERSFIIKKLRMIIQGWSLYYHNNRFFFFFKYRQVAFFFRDRNRLKHFKIRQKFSQFQRQKYKNKIRNSFFKRFIRDQQRYIRINPVNLSYFFKFKLIKVKCFQIVKCIKKKFKEKFKERLLKRQIYKKRKKEETIQKRKKYMRSQKVNILTEINKKIKEHRNFLKQEKKNILKEKKMLEEKKKQLEKKNKKKRKLINKKKELKKVKRNLKEKIKLLKFVEFCIKNLRSRQQKKIFFKNAIRSRMREIIRRKIHLIDKRIKKKKIGLYLRPDFIFFTN